MAELPGVGRLVVKLIRTDGGWKQRIAGYQEHIGSETVAAPVWWDLRTRLAAAKAESSDDIAGFLELLSDFTEFENAQEEIA